MTKKSPPAAPETVAELEAEVARVNADWVQYRSVQPLLPGAVRGGGFDPTMLVRKYRLGVELDGLMVRLEAAKAERAKADLAALLDPAADARLTAEKDAAHGRMTEARAALAEAERAFHGAAHAVRERADRIGRAKERAAVAEGAGGRWKRELDRDRTMLGQYEDYARHAA